MCQDSLTDGFQNTRALCPMGHCWCSPQKLWLPADPQLLLAQCAVLALKYGTCTLLLADRAFHLFGRSFLTFSGYLRLWEMDEDALIVLACISLYMKQFWCFTVVWVRLEKYLKWVGVLSAKYAHPASSFWFCFSALFSCVAACPRMVTQTTSTPTIRKGIVLSQVSPHPNWQEHNFKGLLSTNVWVASQEFVKNIETVLSCSVNVSVVGGSY